MSSLPESAAPKERQDKPTAPRGAFIISLDFELFWGVRDIYTREQYGRNLFGARAAIPQMLELFRKFSVRATFATVGLLFFQTKAEMLAGLPARKPAYRNRRLSPYEGYLDAVGHNETADPLHFAPSLIQQIKTAGQEVACHTFSHYYCVEPGQTIEDFRDDLAAARRAAEPMGIELRSLVFPRNQHNPEYLQACESEGIRTYRGNEKTWLVAPRATRDETKPRRVARLLDAYLNLTGDHVFELPESDGLINLPSSRFLRPWNPKLRLFEPLRLARITRAMTEAARRNLGYHLWWHPHNFGAHTRENLAFLEAILRHFANLQRDYAFASASMSDLAGGDGGANHVR